MSHLQIIKDAISSGDTDTMIAELYKAQRQEPATVNFFRNECIKHMSGDDVEASKAHRKLLSAWYDNVARGSAGPATISETRAANQKLDREFKAGGPKEPEEG